MKPVKKILAPTDFSERSLSGVRYALNLAREIGAEVTAYYVVCPDEFIRYELEHVRPLLLQKTLAHSRARLAEFLAAHFGLSNLEQEVELGTPEERIVDKAAREKFDLIVISTHGRTGLAHVLMGSVTEAIIRRAPCPVISIRPEAEAKPLGENPR